MIHDIPLEILIIEEQRRRQQEEDSRIHLELPLPQPMPRHEERAPSNSAEILDIYGEDEEEDSQRGVTIISIFGD